MESSTRLLIFATYALAGSAIIVFAWLGGLYYGDRTSAGSEAAAAHAERPHAESAGGHVSGVHVDYLFAQRAQIERLQKLLLDKTALLEKKNQLLEQKTAEQRALESDLDEALGTLEVFVATQWLRGDAQTSEQEAELQVELERLRDERNRSTQLAEQMENDLDALRAELVATDENIAQLQQLSELETTVLLAEMQTFQTVASDALAGLGVEAVPALVELLADPRPRIRRWAAAVLGEVGAPASEAVPALLEAQRDEDPTVRLAARSALDRIQPPKP